jgi:hypothetical protein
VLLAAAMTKTGNGRLAMGNIKVMKAKIENVKKETTI